MGRDVPRLPQPEIRRDAVEMQTTNDGVPAAARNNEDKERQKQNSSAQNAQGQKRNHQAETKPKTCKDWDRKNLPWPW